MTCFKGMCGRSAARMHQAFSPAMYWNYTINKCGPPPPRRLCAPPLSAISRDAAHSGCLSAGGGGGRCRSALLWRRAVAVVGHARRCCGRAVLKDPYFFFWFRAPLKDSRQGPPTADKAQARRTKPCHTMPAMPCFGLARRAEASERTRVCVEKGYALIPSQTQLHCRG